MDGVEAVPTSNLRGNLECGGNPAKWERHRFGMANHHSLITTQYHPLPSTIPSSHSHLPLTAHILHSSFFISNLLPLTPATA